MLELLTLRIVQLLQRSKDLDEAAVRVKGCESRGRRIPTRLEELLTVPIRLASSPFRMRLATRISPVGEEALDLVERTLLYYSKLTISRVVSHR